MLFHEFRQIAGRADFYTHIYKYAEHAQCKLRVFERTAAVNYFSSAGCCLVGSDCIQINLIWERRKVKDHRHHHKSEPEDPIGRFYTFNTGYTGRSGNCSENGKADQKRTNCSTEIIDTSGHAQTLGTRMRITHNDCERIGSRLLKRKPESHDKQS